MNRLIALCSMTAIFKSNSTENVKVPSYTKKELSVYVTKNLQSHCNCFNPLASMDTDCCHLN